MSDPLRSAVDTVIHQCLGVGARERVLVVTDPPKRKIAEALVDVARGAEAEVVLVEMSERETHGSEPPPQVAAALLSCDVFVAPTTKSMSHTEARRVASENGARGATMPDITEDMLARTMNADFEAVRRRSAAVAKLLTDGSEVRITTQAGTDLALSIEGRTAISDDGRLTEPGAFGNLPAGEGFVAPLEGTTNGRLVVDGTMALLGRLHGPLTIDIEDGYARRFSGERAAELEDLLQRYGPEAFAIAELGIGTNEAAQLTGNVLEDEKILGTIHIAFGDNHSFGGTIRVESHQDGIVLQPSMQIDRTEVLENGRFLI